MKVKDLIPNCTFNNKVSTNFSESIDILNEFGFTLISEKACPSLKFKIFTLKYKDQVYKLRVPTTYEFMALLHDNILNLTIKTEQEVGINKKANNIIDTFDKYENCNKEIKDVLLENKIIKLNDIITEDLYYLIDYNSLDGYILRNQNKHLVAMKQEELNFIFGVE